MLSRIVLFFFFIHGIAQAVEPYQGYKNDISALRETYKISKADDRFGSSANAIKAAKRIFSKISFLHMTKTEVLILLGEPGSISSYGIASNKYPTKLVYRFDSGYNGLQYELHFRSSNSNSSCYKVEFTGIN